MQSEVGFVRRKDYNLMESSIRSVSSAWRNQLAVDPTYDYKDLQQELRVWYWVWWKKNKKHPRRRRVRTWAKRIIRNWGYKGNNNWTPKYEGLLRSERLEQEKSFSNHPALIKNSITDEEMLDCAVWRRGDSDDPAGDS